MWRRNRGCMMRFMGRGMGMMLLFSRPPQHSSTQTPLVPASIFSKDIYLADNTGNPSGAFMCDVRITGWSQVGELDSKKSPRLGSMSSGACVVYNIQITTKSNTTIYLLKRYRLFKAPYYTPMYLPNFFTSFYSDASAESASGNLTVQFYTAVCGAALVVITGAGIESSLSPTIYEVTNNAIPNAKQLHEITIANAIELDIVNI
ncbi:hypothetical protein BDQ17DRAFT_272399 [Cyathus striatus]|nr:hypothetical protein BDQ17DRAFT_272399 [Cyathus striatus]